MKKLIAVWILLFLLPDVQATDLRVYLVGNSLTDGVRSDKGLQSIVANETTNTFNKNFTQHQLSKYSQIQAGAPLWWHWYENNYYDSFAPELTTNEWDVISLQPYTGPLYTNRNGREEGDVTMCSNFIDLAVNQGLSSNLQVYIYSTWPSVPGYTAAPDYENFDFETNWPSAYGVSSIWSDGHRRRPYYEALVREVQAQWDGVLEKEVLMIPTGDVLFELNRRLRANPQAGEGTNVYSDIEQLYRDGNHLSQGIGAYIGAMTFYATFYKESPVGLSTGKYNDITIYYTAEAGMQTITTNMQALIQQTVWDVVSTHPYAGIAPTDHDRDGLPNAWEKQHFGGTTNASPDTVASNGVNTLLECYIAGLNPADSSAQFELKSASPLSWNAADGRVYKVYWSSNLLNGFEIIATNVTGGGFTDTVHSAANEGFYKIEVQLNP